MEIEPPPWPPRRALPAWAVDLLLGVAVATVMSLVISADHGGRQAPDLIAYLWAIGLGALMLARRRHPVPVLAVSVLGLFAYYAAGYPAVGVAVPIAAAVLSAAEFGRIWWAIGAGAVTLAVSVAFRLAEGQQPSTVVGYELAGHLLLIAAATAVGDGIRSRRRLLASSREVVALTAERAEREFAERMRAERIAVARDLHDSVGHSTAVISLHTEVAREAIDRNDHAAATDALDLVKRTSSSAMAELRRTVAALRSADAPARNTARLADIPTLIDTGDRVQVHTTLDVPDGLPAVVEATAFRIIQEAVTNALTHSTATTINIAAQLADRVLELTVTDNGRPRRGDTSTSHRGHGIPGMRERVSVLGGHLETGPVETGGFAVRASIPLEERA